MLNDSRTDPLARRVIGAYNPESSYKVNLLSIKGCKSAPVEACAKLLGFTVKDEEGKKCYKNLEILSDRIILKIESLFEMHCDECNDEYCNTLEDTPLLHCRLCMQGSHNCDALKLKVHRYNECLEDSAPIKGLVWLCHECMSKNDLTLSAKVKPKPTTATEQDPSDRPEEETPVEGEEEETTSTAQETEHEDDRESPRRGRQTENNTQPAPRDNSKNNAICEMYKRRECPHGRTGKTTIDGKACNKAHPPRCRKYCTNGLNKKGGCKFGNECKYWHPRLCRDSVKNKLCLKKDTCTFFHLKGTMRKIPQDTKEQPRNSNPAPDTVIRPSKARFSLAPYPDTPYPPTVNARQPKPRLSISESKDESFLVKLIESMKEGIITQMNEQITDLRLEIPLLVRDIVQSTSSNAIGNQMPIPMFHTAHQLYPTMPAKAPQMQQVLPNGMNIQPQFHTSSY